MKARLITLCVALAAVVAIRWWFSKQSHETGASSAATSREKSALDSLRSALPPGDAAPATADDRSHLADELNAPAGTIGNDVRVLEEIFAHWATNFPRAGNPVGTNAEITAALTGKNKLGLALIPPDHAAINRDGELVDRWGTPFRFHQWSGTVMEVISAGPDKKFATADDASSRSGAMP
jgi:hypothetical protein